MLRTKAYPKMEQFPLCWDNLLLVDHTLYLELLIENTTRNNKTYLKVLCSCQCWASYLENV